jgi:hypothetical protein
VSAKVTTAKLPEPVRDLAPGWLAARRHAVPARMVAEATERRLAGDWRGACAAAAVDVRIDAVTAQLADDLRHLAPDLVRWHLPRHAVGGSGVLVPDVTVLLARYRDPAGGRDLALSVHTPQHLERPQRLVLRFGPAPADDDCLAWHDARFLWDDRATGGLLHHVGGGDRAPFHHRDGRRLHAGELPGAAPTDGDPVALTEWVTLLQDAGRHEEAWTAAGVEADFTPPKDSRNWWTTRPVDECAAAVTTLMRAVRQHPPQWMEAELRPPSYRRGWMRVVVSVHGGRLRARLFGPDRSKTLPAAPPHWWNRSSDLDLLRFGLIGPDALHPLVRAALFPDRPDAAPYTPIAGRGSAEPFAVRCRGAWHRVGWRDGRIDALAHDADEFRRERVMRSLGGAVPGCFATVETWYGKAGRLPRALRELRGHAISAVRHGDADELARLLAAGVDPGGLRDRRGRGLLHLIAHLDEPRLVPALTAAGLDVNGTDAAGRPPLLQALFDGAGAAVIRALLDAGADPSATDDADATALHVLRVTDAGAILPWLLDAGLDLEARDGYGRTPLQALLIAAAPAEALRALLDAGADPAATEEYGDSSVADLVPATRREELRFVLDACAAAGDPR